MVLTLTIPGVSKGGSWRSKRCRSTTSLASAATTVAVQDADLPTATSSDRLLETTTSTSSSSLASCSSTVLLSEARPSKPTEGSAGRFLPGKGLFKLLPRETPEEARERQELNDGIAVLARLFPDIKIAVFRELLERFDGDSRLHVCVDQLLRYPAQYVRGRWRTDEAAAGSGSDPVETEVDNDNGDSGSGARGISSVPAEELFRSKEYKTAVKLMLAQQFPALKEGAIDNVLADVNYSFSRARPALRELSRNSWRTGFGSFLHFRRKRRSSDAPPTLFWEDGHDTPSMRESGSAELDKEIYEEFVGPVVAQRQEEQETQDLCLAEKLNAMEARDAEALYECCCCLSDVTFEQIADCSAASHIVCFTCIQRTMHQAIFGQGWASTVDSSKATIQCLAPLSRETCDGLLDCNMVKRAVLTDKSGAEIYRKFEDRLAELALVQSQLKLLRCPFCSYAEVDPIFHPSSSPGLVWKFRRDNLRQTIPLVIFMFDILPLVICLFLAFLSLCPDSLTSVFQASLRNISLRNRSRRFVCSNPSCRKQSCLTCHRTWKDPHACHEHLFYSLRDTIEAARTAAVKRTCARCGLSFVRAGGCNKMICICGYVMCYMCRKPLGPNPLSQRQGRAMVDVAPAHGPYAHGALLENAPVAVDLGEAEGYRHFCEHFRADPDHPCTKCTKCNLYAVEDDEAVARSAAEKAEREWCISQGMAGATLPPELERKRSHLPGNMPRRRRGKGHQQQQQQQQQHGFFGADWDWDDVLQFLTVDLWKEERWETVTQNLVDRLVETVVVVVDN